MAQINVNNLTFCYENSFDNIFENVSFSIDTSWKLGFIGRNGKGKTTFLKLLMKKFEYKGSISTTTVFDYFPYHITNAQMKKCAIDFMEEIKPDHESWKVMCELEKLNLDAEVLYRSFETLSHGERTKVMLALLFSGDNNFLLIDEPTNHLDQESRATVKGYLSKKNSFILVSHDRNLLDACIDHVLVLNRCSIEVQSGNFSSWWENKSRKDIFVQKENEKHLKEISKLKIASQKARHWADKNESTKIGYDPIKEHDRCKGTRAYIGAKTKKMQSRVKQMEERIDKEIIQKEGLLQDLEAPADLKIVPLTHNKNVLCSISGYSLKYADAHRHLFENLNMEIKQKERVILSGKNGCGKSSLIKAILIHQKNKLLLSDYGLTETGILETASGLTISYVSQDTSFLKGSIFEFCREKNLDESLFCSLLRQLDFDRVQFTKDMREFSQGQKKKVLIAAGLIMPAHLYIWDEPLNYVDLFSRMQIEKLILKYCPTMLIVEHDVMFCEKIATKTICIS